MQFRDWIRSLEVQFQIFSLPQEHHRFILVCLLDLEVTKFLQDVDPQKYATYDALKQYVQQLFDCRLDSEDAHMNVFYSLRQGETETSVRYLQRLQIELFKGKPELKNTTPKALRHRAKFIKNALLRASIPAIVIPWR